MLLLQQNGRPVSPEFKNHLGDEFLRSFGERIQAAIADGL